MTEIKFMQKLTFTHLMFDFFMKIFQLILFMLYTGKTLLAKAVANQTSATFLRVVGSELIQKYLVCLHNHSYPSYIDFIIVN